MGLEELAFDVEGVKVKLKPELHIYHSDANDDPFLGLVPVSVNYLVGSDLYDKEKKSLTILMGNGFLRYDAGKKIFITALSDLVPTDPKNVELLEKYAQGMSEAARVYSALLRAKPLLTSKPIITQKHYFQNSQGEWKYISHWRGVESQEELLKMADAVK